MTTHVAVAEGPISSSSYLEEKVKGSFYGLFKLTEEGSCMDFIPNDQSSFFLSGASASCAVDECLAFHRNVIAGTRIIIPYIDSGSGDEEKKIQIVFCTTDGKIDHSIFYGFDEPFYRFAHEFTYLVLLPQEIG